MESRSTMVSGHMDVIMQLMYRLNKTESAFFVYLIRVLLLNSSFSKHIYLYVGESKCLVEAVKRLPFFTLK